MAIDCAVCALNTPLLALYPESDPFSAVFWAWPATRADREPTPAACRVAGCRTWASGSRAKLGTFQHPSAPSRAEQAILALTLKSSVASRPTERWQPRVSVRVWRSRSPPSAYRPLAASALSGPGPAEVE